MKLMEISAGSSTTKKVAAVAKQFGLEPEELKGAIEDYRSFVRFHRGAHMYDPSGVKAFYHEDLDDHPKRDALFDALMAIYGS